MGTENAGAPGTPTQLPPSSFDSAMNAMNMGDAHVIHGDPPGAGSSVNPQNRLDKSSHVPKPPGGHAEALPDAGIDPNDPAEIAAREELQRGLPQADEAGKTIEERAQNDAAAIDEWMKAKDDMMLSPIFDEKLVEVPWGDKGEMRPVTVAELKKGYQSKLYTTRKLQEAGEIRRTAEVQTQNVQRMLGDLFNEKTMRTTLEDLGAGEIFERAAEQLYQERLEQEKIFYDLKRKGASDEHLGYLREQAKLARQSTLEKRRLTRERDNALAQRQQDDAKAQEAQQATQLEHQLNQLRPAAFKKLGVPNDAVHNAAFGEQFLAILQTGAGRGRDLREIVLDAAEAAKQFVEERVGAHRETWEQERQQEQQRVQPYSAQRLPGAAPREGSGVTPARQQRKGLADFDAEMARMNGGGR